MCESYSSCPICGSDDLFPYRRTIECNSCGFETYRSSWEKIGQLKTEIANLKSENTRLKEMIQAHKNIPVIVRGEL